MTYESDIKAQGEEPVAVTLDGRTFDGRDEPRSKKSLYILIALVVLAAIVALYVFLTMGAEEEVADRGAQAPAITVVSPGRTTVEGQIVATGVLAARREAPVGVVGEGGRVVSIPVEAGDWVRQGQVLAVIDRSVQSQQARAAAAQIEVAQADANLAQSNLDRALQLVERGFVSKADVDRLTATRDAAVARVRVAQASLSELQARNARLNIVAPSAGLVLERNVEVGATVSAGSGPLFRLARGGEIEMLAQVGEEQLARLSAGVSAEVTPVGSDKSFTGQVWQVSPTIDTRNRQGTARIALSYDPALRPGGFATARILSGTTTAPLLPESAVLSDSEGSFVYVVDDENKVQRMAVETGMVTSEGVVIESGISGNEKIVLRAGGFLTEGETVNPRSADD
ncbi:efflux RND transporter periplasmic adaptor subunit [Qipengyuania gelatinilytica]|uniref:Efflux RND transporter periplasmic adaptor subunit n=1 Tax=Qipengyuania gelatinilytica TaxID=2867231 RepID=A0ABX8ZYX2_9SPHN|nr:efflux RND transporter periplasmic adaptor subunit [Qipengyuania gelatinilytica]QZD94220.1 efflux RND transporter periplasmic adaptor subunit [Qipengyuania gelatinilytica]